MPCIAVITARNSCLARNRICHPKPAAVLFLCSCRMLRSRSFTAVFAFVLFGYGRLCGCCLFLFSLKLLFISFCRLCNLCINCVKLRLILISVFAESLLLLVKLFQKLVRLTFLTLISILLLGIILLLSFKS